MKRAKRGRAFVPTPAELATSQRAIDALNAWINAARNHEESAERLKVDAIAATDQAILELRQHLAVRRQKAIKL